MQRVIVLILLLWTKLVDGSNYTNPSQNYTFTLNSNLVANPNISIPVISPSYDLIYHVSQSGWTTKVHFIKYVDACQESKYDSRVCPTFGGVTCGWQFLGTDSLSFNEQYYQTFNLSASLELQLQLDWVAEISTNVNSTGFKISWNNVVIDSIYSYSCQLQTSTYYLMSLNGSNQLVIQGIGVADRYGILFRNVKLQQLVYVVPTNTSSNSTTNSTNNITTNLTTVSNNTSNLTSNSSSNSIYNSTSNYTSNSTSNSTNNSSDSGQASNSTSNVTSNASQISNSSLNINNSSQAQAVTNINFQNLNQVLNGSQYQSLFRVFSIIQAFELTKSVNTFSTLKQNAKCIVGFILEFNHLLLYNYHLLNYTVSANIILTGINALDDQKGSVLDNYIYPVLDTSPEDITSEFQLQNDLPVNINNALPQLNDYVQRPNGIMLEFTDMLFLDLPIMLVIFSVGYLAFRLLFRYRLSVVFRQYSIMGCFFYMFWEGKIEVLTFYFLSDLLLLVNVHFEQKMKTVLILVVYFSVFVLAVGGMLFLKANYTRLLKYIYDNCKNPKQSSFHVTFEFGLFNLILGFTHRILLNFPLPQLYLLIVIETAYLTYLTVYLARRSYENMILGAILWSMNCARLIFIVTFLVYELSPELESQVGVVQRYFFYSFVILWGLSSLFSFLEKLSFLFKIIRKACKSQNQKNKVSPQPYIIEDYRNRNNRQIQSYPPTQKNLKVTVVFINDEKYVKSSSMHKGGFRKTRRDRQFNLGVKSMNVVSSTTRKCRLLNSTHKKIINFVEN